MGFEVFPGSESLDYSLPVYDIVQCSKLLPAFLAKPPSPSSRCHKPEDHSIKMPNLLCHKQILWEGSVGKALTLTCVREMARFEFRLGHQLSLAFHCGCP